MHHTTCTYVNSRGARCPVKPRESLGKSRCGRHNNARSYIPCRVCEILTRSPKNICAKCQRSRWRQLEASKLPAELADPSVESDDAPALSDSDIYEIISGLVA